MLDLVKFYNGLFNRTNSSDGYWNQFPKGKNLQFKKESLALLKENIQSKNAEGLRHIVTILMKDGADNDFTDLLLSVARENWHHSIEDIISVLEIIKDPNSIDRLYEIAIDVPEYDEMRAIAKKCIWALLAINTPESLNKLKILQASDDEIISEFVSGLLEDTN